MIYCYILILHSAVRVLIPIQLRDIYVQYVVINILQKRRKMGGKKSFLLRGVWRCSACLQRCRKGYEMPLEVERT